MARTSPWFFLLLLSSSLTICSFKRSNEPQSLRNVESSNCSNTSSKVLKSPNNTACNRSLHNVSQRNAVFAPAKSVEEFCVLNKIQKENCSCERSLSVCRMESWLTYQHTKPDFDLAVAIVVITALVLGVVGNSAVVVSTLQRRDELSKHEIVITLLALTDGVSSILNFLHTSPFIWTGDTWTFGIPLCKLILTGMMACSWLSSGFILIIALERFFGIVYPFKDMYSYKVMYTCVAVNLILVLSSGVPMTITSSVRRGVCHNFARDDILIPYHWVLMVIFMIAPMSTVSFFYFRIIYHLHQSTHSVSVSSRDDIRLRRLKENRRTVKILLLIVVAFIVCVLPVNAIDLYVAYFKVDGYILGLDYLLMRDLLVIYNISYPLHACVNPIIYTSIDPSFRKKVLNIFASRGRNSKPSANSTTTATVTTSI